MIKIKQMYKNMTHIFSIVLVSVLAFMGAFIVDALAEKYTDALSSPAAQASPKAPGFGVLIALTGLLVVM